MKADLFATVRKPQLNLVSFWRTNGEFFESISDDLQFTNPSVNGLSIELMNFWYVLIYIDGYVVGSVNNAMVTVHVQISTPLAF